MKTIIDLYDKFYYTTERKFEEYINEVYLSIREKGKKELKRDLCKVKFINFWENIVELLPELFIFIIRAVFYTLVIAILFKIYQVI